LTTYSKFNFKFEFFKSLQQVCAAYAGHTHQLSHSKPMKYIGLPRPSYPLGGIFQPVISPFIQNESFK